MSNLNQTILIGNAIEQIHELTEANIMDIVDALTGIAWDEEEARQIKARFTGHPVSNRGLIPAVNRRPTPPSGSVPDWVAEEIKATWRATHWPAELQTFRIIERMVDRLGYGRIENNP